ncbi:phage virion morphogenesis protein [Stenotrophomonas sp. B1-1]|uniref:phage virion morphogenesis protein n=1 Tax=Stenotrophomonas sp. B1-1 TaxID=2710648 RepID=UPI0013DB6760|nr:phage virion morphogenesis protein [Stenotrophomonas sp. B1-1]
MAGARLDIVADEGQLGRQLQQLIERAGDLGDALGEIGEIVTASTQARFGQGVDPSGSPWAPLAASTLAQKKGPGTLRESLHLQGSIRYQVEGEAVRIGTDVPYAAAHQFGTPAWVIRPRNGKALAWPGAAHPVKQVNHPGLPARPFLGLSTEDEDNILAMLADYLAGV